MKKNLSKNADDKTYSGINVQFPISEMILSGQKTIETRTYPIPERYKGVELVLIETPGKQGKFKARMAGIVVFGESFQYKNKSEFYADTKRHCVTPDSIWKWDASKEKWGWPVLKIKRFKKPQEMTKRGGIVFATGLTLNDN